MDRLMTQTRPEELGQDELEFATFHEGYVSRYIQLADAKAGTALVVTAGTLGYLLGQTAFVSAILFKSGCGTLLLAVITGLLLAGSASLSFIVIAPRGSKPGAGLVYWGDVARRSPADFIDAVRAAGPDGIARERLTHAHAIAKVCQRKYEWLRGALALGAAGMAAALACRMIL
jgi:hypothetical protein